MSEHDDIKRQLPAYAAQLLSESEEAVVFAHLEACEACRLAATTLETMPPALGVDRGHIPAGVLARWPRATQELRGLERELVSSHLDACAECRGALQVLGHVASLERHPSLARSHVRRSGSLSRRELVLGSWAALATAAAMLIGVAPIWRRPDGPTPAPPPSVRPDEALARFEGSVLVPLSAPSRGGEGESAPVVHVDSTTALLVLELPPQGLRREEVERVIVELRDASGAVISSRAEPTAGFGGAHSVVIRAAGGSWTAGDYVLRLRILPTPAALVREPFERNYPFRLTR